MVFSELLDPPKQLARENINWVVLEGLSDVEEVGFADEVVGVQDQFGPFDDLAAQLDVLQTVALQILQQLEVEGTVAVLQPEPF